MTPTPLAAAATAYARNSTPDRLLAPLSRWVFTLTGGRHGRLRISARRWSRVVDAAVELGRAEAASLDPWSDRPYPATGALVAQFGDTFSHAIRADYAPLRGRARNAITTAAQRAPLFAFIWVILVGIVVFLVDHILNVPLVSRLADVHPIAVHAVSAGIALLLVLAGHFTVADTPPGQTSQARSRLKIAGLAGAVVFVGLGGFLRVHAATATATTPDITGGGSHASAWTDLWPTLVSWGSMAGLMVLTFAISALASLHIITRTHRLTADGPEVTRNTRTADHVDHTLLHLIDHARSLTATLVHANHTGYRAAVHPDLADRTQPHPLPDHHHQPALTD